MTDTPTVPLSTGLPGDPDRLHLTITCEIGPVLAAGERSQTHRLLARYPQERDAAEIRRPPNDGLSQVALLGLCQIPMDSGSVSTALLADLENTIPRGSEVISAVHRDALTNQNDRSEFTTVLRKMLGQGPYGDLGNLLIVNEFTFDDGWDDPGLGVLLLGELVARAGSGPCVVATAPKFLNGAQGYQRTLAVLSAAGFRPLRGHTTIVEPSGLPAFSGPAGTALIRLRRASGG
ncbi:MULTISPECIES: hypothetical protein [unclassified Kitasatospora]|uniref:hypothetical protein n=1 Tax=unclassified Kitasatospora TaxID=2633591 RepID=UPI0037FC26EF